MSDVRAKLSVPTTGDFVGITTPSQCPPLVVDSGTGALYVWTTGDVIVPATIERRTSDPSSPLVGQIWLRTDL